MKEMREADSCWAALGSIEFSCSSNSSVLMPWTSRPPDSLIEFTYAFPVISYPPFLITLGEIAYLIVDHSCASNWLLFSLLYLGTLRLDFFESVSKVSCIGPLSFTSTNMGLLFSWVFTALSNGLFLDMSTFSMVKLLALCESRPSAGLSLTLLSLRM